MSVYSSILNTEKTIDLDTDIDEIKNKVDNITREKESLVNELKYKEKEYQRQVQELIIDNQMLKKTINNLEELTKKLKNCQNIPENSKEKMLDELQTKYFELENQYIICKNSESRLKLDYEQLLNENSQLKKEAHNINDLKKSVVNQNVLIDDEDEDLNNVESLRDIILDLSKEYDELKIKYKDNLDLYYEKERIIIQLKEKHNKMEDDFIKKIFEYEDQIRKLNQILEEYKNEIDNNLIPNNLHRASSRVIRYLVSNTRTSYFSYNDHMVEDDKKGVQNNNPEENIEELLLNEIEEKDKIIEEIKQDFSLKMKSIEERYTSHLHHLETELQKYQESLSKKDEYKKILQGEINQIDESNQIMKEEIQSLHSKLKEAELIKKNCDFLYKNAIEKQEQEIKEYIHIIEKVNKKHEDLERNYKNLYEKNDKLTKENNDMKEKYLKKDKELKFKKEEFEILKRDYDVIVEEKKIIKKEYLDFKEEFMNFQDKYKDNICKQMDDIEFENRKLKKIIENQNGNKRISTFITRFPATRIGNNNLQPLNNTRKLSINNNLKEDTENNTLKKGLLTNSTKKFLPLRRAVTILNFNNNKNEETVEINDETPTLNQKLKTETNEHVFLSNIMLDNEFDCPQLMKKMITEDNIRSSEIFYFNEDDINNQIVRTPVKKNDSYIDILPEKFKSINQNQRNLFPSKMLNSLEDPIPEEIENVFTNRNDDKDCEINEMKAKITELEATISILNDDKDILQKTVKDLKEEISKMENSYEKNINELKQSNLVNNIRRRSVLISSKLAVNVDDSDLYQEKKIKSLEAEIEFYNNKIKIIENDYSSKNLILEEEVKFLKIEIESYQNSSINLKVQLATALLEIDSNQVRNNMIINKLNYNIKMLKEVLAKHKSSKK